MPPLMNNEMYDYIHQTCKHIYDSLTNSEPKVISHRSFHNIRIIPVARGVT